MTDDGPDDLASAYSTAIGRLYRSYELAGSPHGVPDASVREPAWAERLLHERGLLPLGRPTAIVVGSKGKGSTVRQIVAPLVASGLRVGWVTSPHLVDYAERIRIDDRTIPHETLVRLVDEIAPALDRFQSQLDPGRYVGPHAGILAVALAWFREESVDVIVLEGGRGGRFDEVSVVGARFAAIPTVLLEHRLELGPTLADVARHKAGAIPEGGFAVVGPVGSTARRILAAEARERRATLEWFGQEISTEPARHGVTIRTPAASYREIELGLAGDYQAANAAIAVRVAELLHEAAGHGDLPPGAVREGLARLASPGRMQEVPTDRLWLLDTAVHRTSIDPIVEWMRRRRDEGRGLLLVLSIPTDKDWRSVARALAPLADGTVFARPVDRPLPYDEAAIVREARRLPAARPSVVDGAPAALGLARDVTVPGDAVAIVGTQSFIAQGLEALGVDAGVFWRPRQDSNLRPSA